MRKFHSYEEVNPNLQLFAGDIFPNVGELYPPFIDLSQVITDDSLWEAAGT